MPCKSASELRNWHGRSVRVEVICRKQSRPRSSYCQGNDVWNSKQTIRETMMSYIERAKKTMVAHRAPGLRKFVSETTARVPYRLRQRNTI